MNCIPHQVLFGHQVKEDETGGAYDMYGKKRNHTRLWWGNLNVITS